MCAMASQITSLTIVYSTVYSGTDQKKTPKPRVTGLCEGNSPVTGEFPAQRASNAENVSIWWRHRGIISRHSCHVLTRWGRVTHICVGHLTIINSNNGLFSWSAPNQYLNQWWNIVNWTLGNKLQWKFSRNSYIFVQRNAFENVTCKIPSISSRPQCVKVYQGLRRLS